MNHVSPDATNEDGLTALHQVSEAITRTFTRQGVQQIGCDRGKGLYEDLSTYVGTFVSKDPLF